MQSKYTLIKDRKKTDKIIITMKYFSTPFPGNFIANWTQNYYGYIKIF